MRRTAQMTVATFAVSLVGLLAWMGSQYIGTRDGDEPLAIRWEGLWIDYNHRDLGTSLNECLGEQFYAKDRVQRANVWFSGWSCDKVGNPDVIYSLNYFPEREERYFCRDGERNKVGRHFQDFKLNDLEFLETWDLPGVTTAVCGFIRDELTSLTANKKILIHCDAGKDRTGLNSALLGALAAEQAGRLDDRMIEALECDYRKSKKLEQAKYGRIQKFITTIRDSGGVGHFLQERCGLTAAEIAAAATTLVTAR